MFRTIAALVALATVAGCIALPEDPNAEVQGAAVPPSEDRIDGMTAEATMTDRDVPCNEGGGGLVAVPAFCAERVLEVVGRIGVQSLPVSLIGTNGAIDVITSQGDAWSFGATVRVRALTEDMARDGLDTAWGWTHEGADGHALAAGPTASRTPLDPLSPRVIATTYTLALPEWVTIDLEALSDNGAIQVLDRAMDDADLETDNGQIVVTGLVRDLRARTDNGQIVATLRPMASGKIDLSTDNGQVILKVPESRERGYDIEGSTDNGQVVITLRECVPRGGERDSYDYTSAEASCKTSGFEERAIQTTVRIETDNAQAVVSPL